MVVVVISAHAYNNCCMVMVMVMMVMVEMVVVTYEHNIGHRGSRTCQKQNSQQNLDEAFHKFSL
jgi:uncharacterized membrane protein